MTGGDSEDGMAGLEDEAQKMDVDIEIPAPVYEEEVLQYEAFMNASISTSNMRLTLGLAIKDSRDLEQSMSSESEKTY